MGKIICDPVHGVMNFEDGTQETLFKIIDSTYFQRLRQIKQLSFAEFAYPGAVHNRFSHSIGTAYLSTLVYSSLKGADSDQDQKTSLAIVALLHDIGHGPFSHAFEGIINSILREKGVINSSKESKISHEDWSGIFIDTLIEEKVIGGNYSSEVKDIYKNKDHKLHGVISSQLDVDRFDYLLRDSHFCGVSYGYFDLYWLIDSLKICSADNTICIEEKALNAVEHYIMARRLMNKNVYFHKVKCYCEFLLKNILKLINKNLDQLSKLIKIEDFSFIKLLRKLSSVKASSKEEILKELFNYYEKITDYDIWILLRQIYDTHISSRSPQEIKLLVTLIDSLINRKYHKIYQVKNGYSEFIKNKIKQFHLDNSTTLAQYIINFEPTDFGVLILP